MGGPGAVGAAVVLLRSTPPLHSPLSWRECRVRWMFPSASPRLSPPLRVQRRRPSVRAVRKAEAYTTRAPQDEAWHDGHADEDYVSWWWWSSSLSWWCSGHPARLLLPSFA